MTAAALRLCLPSRVFPAPRPLLCPASLTILASSTRPLETAVLWKPGQPSEQSPIRRSPCRFPVCILFWYGNWCCKIRVYKIKEQSIHRQSCWFLSLCWRKIKAASRNQVGATNSKPLVWKKKMSLVLLFPHDEYPFLQWVRHSASNCCNYVL